MASNEVLSGALCTQTSSLLACPVCEAPVEDSCCPRCGSLEGVDAAAFAPTRVFGFDWASGSVAPWRDAGGRAYATPKALAADALADAGLRRDGRGYVVDLGCGDAAILREAATRFGCRGLGVDVDDGDDADALDFPRFLLACEPLFLGGGEAPGF